MTALTTQSIFENYKELLLFFQQMSNYSSSVFVVSSCTLPFHVFATNINIFLQIGLFDCKFSVYPGSNLCHFFSFPSTCGDMLASATQVQHLPSKAKLAFLSLTTRFQVSHIFTFFSFTIFLLSHSPIHVLEKKKHKHQQQRQQKNSADSTSNATLANKTLKTKCHSQTAGCFIITNLLIPIIPRGIEHVLLFH